MKLKQIPGRTFDLLRRENSQTQLAWGALWGMYLGITPAGVLHWWLLLLLTPILRMNLFAVTVSTLFFWIVSWATAPLCHQIGIYVLTGTPGLLRYWAGLHHSPILPFTNFTNTVVMGSFILSTLLTIPMFLLFRRIGPGLYRSGERALRGTVIWERVRGSKGFLNGQRNK